MVEILRSEKEERVTADDLDPEMIKALSDSTRKEMLEELSRSPSYPAEVAEKFDISKQKAYYHFEKLEEAGLIEKQREEKKSGGMATFYKPSSDAYMFDLGTGGEKTFVPPDDPSAKKFLEPVLDGGEIHGNVVVGSPDPHGEDQVRARDGHLAGDLCLKLGNYGETDELATRLDTEIVREDGFDRNLVILGGILTNTVAKKFNETFDASFSTEDFPYHELRTPDDSYSEDSIGVIEKAENPENGEKAVFLVAGVGNRGTAAAVRAFKNLEDITTGYEEGSFYRILRGLDRDGDGEIDDYEVVE